MIRIAGYVNDSITDGSGLRFALFTQGCPHGCEGCHNPQTHDFNGGKEVSAEEVTALIDANPIITGVTFSGGEPDVSGKGTDTRSGTRKEKRPSPCRVYGIYI